MSTNRFPVLFISHGSPMHAIKAGAAGEAWAAVAKRLPQPQAILMVSAHWETNIPMLTGTALPETIHDFGGFPDELYRLNYPAPGLPFLAEHAQVLLRAAGISAGIDPSRGLDHGAWSPLLHMYPKANIPVVQLSIQSELGARHHFAVGQALSSLRDEGVLIIGSGHMTHNLRDFFHSQRQQSSLEYAVEFRNWVDEHIRTNGVEALLDWETQAPSAQRAHPTPEHFLPLFVAIGAAGPDWKTETIFDRFDGPALAMDAYAFE